MMFSLSNPVDSFQIIKIDCAHQGLIPYSSVRIQGAYMWVESPSMSIKLDTSLNLNASSNINSTAVARLAWFHRTREFKFELKLTPDVLGERLEVVTGEKLTLLTVCYSKKSFGEVYGLVLRPCAGDGINCWMRAGYFSQEQRSGRGHQA
jgi:hypothetical protein